MFFGGIDLSIGDKNTSLCFIEDSKKIKIVFLKDKISEKEIIEEVKKYKPLYIAIDAPITWRKIKDRKEDKILRRYFIERKIKVPGILPFYVKSMYKLSKRGKRIYLKLRKITEVLETHPTASLRAIGFKENYKKNKKELKKILNKLKEKIDKISLIKNHNHLDSLFCALFSLYYYKKEKIFLARKKVPYGIIREL